MFGIFKKKQKEEPVKNLKAIVDGTAKSIEEVPDQIFSSKALGDGVAFEADSSVITAPCDCEIRAMSEDMKHAIGLKLSNGMEVLIHVGIDTVKLEGKGFKQLAKEGMKVKEGEPLLEFNKDVIKENGLCDLVIMILTEMAGVDNYKIHLGEVKQGTSVVEF